MNSPQAGGITAGFSHSEISGSQPIALLAGSKNPDAALYLGYLESAKARPLFEKQGFAVLQ
jgi:ABC-type molybdate transport system substrate-binding protein